MHVIRKAASNYSKTLKFNFPVKGQKFLVKNFTDGEIYAYPGEKTETSSMSLIPADTAEIIFNSERYSEMNSTDVVTVVLSSTNLKGAVEVRCLGW